MQLKMPLNTCAIAYTFYEGDTRVMRYAEALAARGDHVDMIVLRRPGQTRVEHVNGITLYRVQGRSPNTGGKIAYIVEIVWFLVKAMILATRRHCKSGYDLIHVHSVPDFLVFAAWIPKLFGAKVILDIHDLSPELYGSKYEGKKSSFAYRALLKAERSAARFADHIIVANDIWEKKLISRGAAREKCSTLMNFPDRTIFVRRGRTRGEDGKFIIVYPGSLNWHQGLDIAIRAFSRIVREVPEAEFHIFGEGSSVPTLSHLVQTLSLQNKVYLRGYVPTRNLVQIMENADLGVEPKRKNEFGNGAFSTKILEFMALGVPVIASDTDVHCHYLDDSVVKFFSAENDEELARGILLLYRHPELRQRLVTNATQFIERNNWETKKAEYLRLVDAISSGNAASVTTQVSDDDSNVRSHADAHS